MLRLHLRGVVLDSQVWHGNLAVQLRKARSARRSVRELRVSDFPLQAFRDRDSDFVSVRSREPRDSDARPPLRFARLPADRDGIDPRRVLLRVVSESRNRSPVRSIRAPISGQCGNRVWSTREVARAIPFAGTWLFGDERLLFEATDFAFHSCRIAAVTQASEIGGGDHAKRSHFREGLQLRVAKEISAIARVVRAWRVHRFEYPLAVSPNDRRIEDHQHPSPLVRPDGIPVWTRRPAA